MSEANTLFSSNGVKLKSDAGPVLTECYLTVRNLYGEAVEEDVEAQDDLYELYDTLGDCQTASANTPSSRDFEMSDFENLPVERRDTGVVPVNIEATDDMVVLKVNKMLESYLGVESDDDGGESEASDPYEQYGDGDDGDDEDSSDDMDLSPEVQELFEEVKYFGVKAAENLEAYLATNDWEAPDIEAGPTERFSSLDEVVLADDISLSDLSDEQKQSIAPPE